jgi:superfamily II DNA or RNA helicase
MNVTIKVYNQYAFLEGSYDKDVVDEVTSFTAAGVQHSRAYKSGSWDGKTRLYNHKLRRIPSGLVSVVEKALQAYSHTVTIEDERSYPGKESYSEEDFKLDGITMSGSRQYQMDCVMSCANKRKGLLDVCTGGGKSLIAAAITKGINLPTLVTVPSVELMEQMYKTFTSALGASKGEVGVCGDGKWKPGSWVTIAIMDTLESRIDDEACQALLNDTQLLIVDECHLSGAKTWQKVIMKCPAYFRFGVSGTPLDRTDGSNLVVMAGLGEVIHTINYKTLIEAGILPHASIIFDKITSPVLNSKVRDWPKVYAAGISENEDLLAKVVDWVIATQDLGLSCLVLVDHIKQGKAIDEALWKVQGRLIPHTFIHGTEKEARPKALVDFEERRLPVLIASRILDTGISLDSLDVLILASAGKSKIRTLQRLGRVLRGKKAIVVDFLNTCHPFLSKHSLQRLGDYKAEDCFKLCTSVPSAAILKREWDRQEERLNAIRAK